MRTWSILLIMILAGCSDIEATKPEKFVPARSVAEIVSDTVVGTVEGALVAVQTPFEDIGFKKQTIPDKLQQISEHPYVLPAQISCENLRNEIAELDTLLGPDICTPENQIGVPYSVQGEYVEQGANMAREQAVGMVSSKVNIIPFRGVVRHISGADKHSKLVERSYQAGKLRRAFLKGLIVSLGTECSSSPVVKNEIENADF